MPKGIPLNTESFIQLAKTVHDDIYQYDKSVYNGYCNPIEIKCQEHGYFFQTPVVHLRGGKCKKCPWLSRRNNRHAKKKPGVRLKSFLERSKKNHDNNYDYSLVEEKHMNAKNKVSIICKTHGIFKQDYGHHMRGSNCPKCYNKIFRKQNEWLDSLKVSNIQKQVRIQLNDGIKGEYIIADGFNPDTNTIYEFWGNFWHGKPKNTKETINPKTKISYKKSYNDTLLKRKRILNAGFKLVEIWESDWN